jgi:hypothetical protein
MESDIITGDRVARKSSTGKYLPCWWWKDRNFLILTVGPTFLLSLLILLVFALFFKKLGWYC